MSDLRIDAHGNVFLWEWPEIGWSIARVTDLDWLERMMEEEVFGPIGHRGISLRPEEMDEAAWFLLFVDGRPTSSMDYEREGTASGFQGRMEDIGFAGNSIDHARAWIEFFVEGMGLDPHGQMGIGMLGAANLNIDSRESLDSEMLDMREARRQGRSPTGVPILDVDLFLLLDEPPPPLWPLDEFLEFVRQVARG